MRILLTGSTGFTGRHFVSAATAAGYTIVPFDADISDIEATKSQVSLSNPDFVVHLAAISYVGGSDNSAFYSVNTVGTTNLLAALANLQKRPLKVLLTSSANVYGNCPRSPICEAELPVPVNHYAMSKLAMEHMARTYSDRLPIVFTRPFNYTGAGQNGKFIVPKLVEHYLRKATVIELGNIEVEREFNDVRYVCSAYLAILEHGKPGEIYNICSGMTYSLRELMQVLSEVTGHTMDVTVNPKLVRASEIYRLCGDPAKLMSLLVRQKVKMPTLELRDTLKWMCES